MPTRKYNLETRRRKQAELKANIAAATADLHASKGAAATSYADIARHAGVSLPTVYSHFPTEDDLFLGCTTHVASRAPAFPIDEILGANSLSAAIEMLIAAIEEQHLYYEPWLAWRMEGYVSFLAELSTSVRIQQTEMITMVLTHFLGPSKRRKMTAGCETVLCFDCWHRLVRGHRLSRRAARQIMTQSLQAIIGLQPTSKSTSKPRRKP